MFKDRIPAVIVSRYGRRVSAAGGKRRNSKGLDMKNTGRRREKAPERVVMVALACVLVLAAAVPAACEEEPSFKWGFVERIRQAYIDNAFDMDEAEEDTWHYIRVRSQLWCSWEPVEDWMLYVKLNNEHRHWFASTRGYEDEDFEIDEFIIENLYISAENIGGSPFSVTAGRQNIMYGEGFLMMDGGPLDGSRTAYNNAVRVNATVEKRTLELHFLSNPSYDRYLPVVNSLRRGMIEYDEKGGGLYYTDESFAGKKIEGYYFFKNEKSESDGYESNIHTIGGRFSGAVRERFRYAAELAYQTGDIGDADRSGFGGYIHGTYAFQVRMEPSLKAGFIYLSGDDPYTRDCEGWDPLYSRWPKWSELYIYTLALEQGVAYWSDFAAYNTTLSLRPMRDITLNASAYLLETASTPGGLFGIERGFLSIISLKWAMNRNLSGHLLWERFAPHCCSIYGSDDPADFLRWEIMFRY